MSSPQSGGRPVPRANVYMNTAPLWEAAKRKELLLQYCPDTGKYQWFPRPGSLYTGKRNTEWRPAKGTGTLYAWTVTRAAWPGHEARVPYLCALVELDEGVRMLCNLLNCEESQLRHGMRMKLAWETLPDGSHYPAFEPAL